MSAPPRAKPPFKKRLAPRRDLVWVDVELLTYVGQRLLASDRRQRDLRLESRAVVPANASRQIRFCPRQACRAQVENAPALAVNISRVNAHHGALVGAAVDVPPNLESDSVVLAANPHDIELAKGPAARARGRT
jgi:hypothetical protein